MNLPVKVYRFSLCLSVFLPSSHHSWHPYCGCRGRRRVWQLPDVQQRGAEIPRRLQDTQRGWWWWVHPTTTAASCSSLPAVWSHCAHLLSWLCHPACACHIFRVHRCYLDHNDHRQWSQPLLLFPPHTLIRCLWEGAGVDSTTGSIQHQAPQTEETSFLPPYILEESQDRLTLMYSRDDIILQALPFILISSIWEAFFFPAGTTPTRHQQNLLHQSFRIRDLSVSTLSKTAVTLLLLLHHLDLWLLLCPVNHSIRAHTLSHDCF